MSATVYVLTAILVSSHTFKPTEVQIETLVFEDAARCLKNLEGNQAELSKKYDVARIYCSPREIIKKEDIK